MQWLMGLFWPTQKTPLLKENKHYCFVEIDIAGEAVHAVKLLALPYNNVVYYYGHVKLIPEGETHRLAFQYTVWDSAGFPRELLGTSEEFKQHIGDVLVAIIADENKTGEYNAPSRNDDFEEPDL